MAFGSAAAVGSTDSRRCCPGWIRQDSRTRSQEPRIPKRENFAGRKGGTRIDFVDSNSRIELGLKRAPVGGQRGKGESASGSQPKATAPTHRFLGREVCETDRMNGLSQMNQGRSADADSGHVVTKARNQRLLDVLCNH
jgi:hypothetical protein